MQIRDFYGPARSMDQGLIERAANARKIEPEILKAVSIKESPRGAFLPDGRPRILFEAHKFSQFTNHQYDESYPGISSCAWNRSLYGPAGAHQYERLAEAMSLDEKAALMSISIGGWQVMGFNYGVCGFESVQEFIKFNIESEANQFECFVRYLDSAGVVPAMMARDFELIAYRYNGPKYKQNKYDTDLQRIYKELTNNTLRMGSRGDRVVSLQRMLIKQGYGEFLKPHGADGQFGKSTRTAVMAFQKDKNLTVDGIVGAQTYSQMAEAKITTTPIKKSKRVKGSTILGGVGIGVVVDGINKVGTAVQEASSKLEEAVSTPMGSKAKELVIEQATNNGMFQLIIGLVIVGAAGYFIWTKFYDSKKEMES